jgi:putative endonuclease
LRRTATVYCSATGNTARLEIDIIAENDEFIVFVEVKTRSADPLDPPVNAITREKQRGLVWAADAYIKRYGINKESRFDVITLIEKGEEFRYHAYSICFLSFIEVRRKR